MVRAIIFDFDGVLVESMGIKADAFCYVFRDFPYIKKKILNLHNSRGGMSRWDKFRIIYEEYLGKRLSDIKKEQFADEFSNYVFERVLQAPSVKGAMEFLQKYHSRFLYFIVSGTPQDEITEIVNRRGMGRYFKAVLGAPTAKVELNKRILDRYALKPDEVIFVGDSLDDYESAVPLHIPFIGRIFAGSSNLTGLPKIKAFIKDLTELGNHIFLK